jgi:hypothetical protein
VIQPLPYAPALVPVCAAQTQLVTGLLHACRELYKLLYGQDSIYARTPTLSGTRYQAAHTQLRL